MTTVYDTKVYKISREKWNKMNLKDQQEYRVVGVIDPEQMYDGGHRRRFHGDMMGFGMEEFMYQVRLKTPSPIRKQERMHHDKENEQKYDGWFFGDVR